MWWTADPHTGVQIPLRPYIIGVDALKINMIRRNSLTFIYILIFLYILTLYIVSASPALIINEIMYNPVEDDNYYEWIELYNPTNTSINLSGYSITDNTAIDYLQKNNESENQSMELPAQHYALITDYGTKTYENLTISNNTIKIYVDDKTIGNGLGNNDDYIILKNANGTIIDSVEWGIDSPNVAGNPILNVIEGSSIIRTNTNDTNNTEIDFKETILPTPGKQNILIQNGIIKITSYPRYIPKTYDQDQFGFPFTIQVQLTNFSSNQTFQLKAYITGDTATNYPVSQTWDENNWQYSDRFIFNINQPSIWSLKY